MPRRLPDRLWQRELLPRWFHVRWRLRRSVLHLGRRWRWVSGWVLGRLRRRQLLPGWFDVRRRLWKRVLLRMSVTAATPALPVGVQCGCFL